jgi:hypothetical protein
MVCKKCSTVTTRKTHDGPKAGKTMWYAWYFHCLSCGWLYMPDEAKRTLKLLRSATTAPRVGAAQKVPCQKPTAAIPVEELAAHMRINPNKLRQYLAAPLPAVDDDVEAVTPANVEVDLDYLEAEYQRFVASTPADEVETSAVEEDEEILPPLGHPAPAGANHNMPDWPFQTEHVPEEEVEMVLVFGHMVPLSSVTFSSDSEEVAAPPRPRRPYVPAIPAHHAVDLQTARDAEHDANMARINREMAEAADAAPAVEMNTGLVGRQRKPDEENLV